MFGKRPTDGDGPAARKAPPPAAADGVAIATRPQRIEPTDAPTPSTAPVKGAPEMQRAGGQVTAGPKPTLAFEQLRAAQGPAPTTQVVREQTDYYHATKTTSFNALINTIDLAQLAQLDVKQAGEEIRDIVAELVAIKNVSMSVAEQDMLVQDIINDVLGYGPLEPLLARDDIA
ncbi:MAG: CpaF family protein, partial [Phenylobacterium sp.]|nr:CpaF family protein [Phenylobacterium sp.]